MLVTNRILILSILLTGRDILKQNGSAVDAAIAAMFCLGLLSMHSTGIGGGGCMLVYKKDGNNVEAFDYQSMAPGKAREDMFMGEGNRSSIGMRYLSFYQEVPFQVL